MDTKKQLVISTFWTTVARGMSLGSQLISTIVLARILLPSDFAIMGIIIFFISISNSIIDSGMAGYLVKKQNPSDAEFSTMFIFNLSMSIIIYLLCFFLSPSIEKLYSIPNLSVYIRVALISIIVSSLGIVQNIILLRNYKYVEIAKLTTFASIASLGVTIVLAKMGYGIWALIVQNLSLQVFVVLLQIYYARFIPSFSFSFTYLSEQWRFGSFLLFSHILQSIFSNILNLVLPRVYSLRFSGLYSQANKLSQVPINLANNILSTSSFPVLSQIHDEAYFKQMNSQYSSAIIFASTFIMLFLSLFSNELVLIVLGAEWIDASIIFSILCIGGIALIISNIQRNTLKSMARTRDIFYIEILRTVLVAFFVLITYRINEYAIILGFVLSQYLLCAISAYFISRRMSYSIKEQFMDVLHSALPSIISFVVVLMLYRLDNSIYMIIIYMILYFAIVLLVDFRFGNKWCTKIMNIFKND